MSITGRSVIDEAIKFIGDKYVYGAAGPSTFDCSGLVQYVYGKRGIKLPHTSQQQGTSGTAVASAADLQMGDLVFTAGSDGTTAHPGHVGIFAGPDKQGDPAVIEAPHTGANVRVVKLRDFGATSYRRVTGVTGDGGAAVVGGAVAGAASGII